MRTWVFSANNIKLKNMTTQELYTFITKHIPIEQVLLKLLESSLISYEKLKFDDKNETVHPLLIITMAALDLGWDLAIEKDVKEVRGLAVGTSEYLDTIISK